MVIKPKKEGKTPSFEFFCDVKLICDRGHQRILGLRNVETGGLNNYGLVTFNENGIGSVLGDLSAVVGNYLVKTNVIGALVLANGVDSAHRLVIFKIESYVDVGVLTGKVENADRLVADEITLACVAHKAVSNKPYIFSVHISLSFHSALRLFYKYSITFFGINVNNSVKFCHAHGTDFASVA